MELGNPVTPYPKILVIGWLAVHVSLIVFILYFGLIFFTNGVG